MNTVSASIAVEQVAHRAELDSFCVFLIASLHEEKRFYSERSELEVDRRHPANPVFHSIE